MDSNKENLIEKYHLTEAHNRLQQLFEYSFYGGGAMYEDGQDPNGQQQPPQQEQPPQQGMPDMNSAAPGQPVGGDMQDPNMGMPQQDPGMDGSMPQGGDPMGGAQGTMGGGMPEDTPVEEEVPMDGDTEEPIEDDGAAPEPMQPDDEVIDVDELTNAQETTEYKIDGVNDKLSTLMDVMTKYAEALQLSNDKIDSLKAEIEKRNPTEEERLNIRSQSSSPFTEDPKDFWEKKKNERPNYNVIFDNDVPANEEDKEYVIKRKDIDGENDRSIYDSLDVPQSLKNVLSF